MADSVWTHLSASPVTWLLATLMAYRFSLAVYEKAGRSPLAHPVAVSVALLVTGLGIAQVPYETYFDGARFIHFLLGPATVALAIPLYAQLKRIRRSWPKLLAGALLGSAASVITAVGIASLLGASHMTVLSMAAKSVTMPIAIGITGEIGGTASLTSALVMLTGILGATTAQGILKRMGMTDPGTSGFALGVAAHGIGASRAFQLNQEMGAFAGLAMGLAGALTATLLPFCLRLAGF
ncbi:LrgB family protein [Noviherbaspirillum sp.]|uniref:LrgB family protein n=1 Tax=Noviherbaspirillum sp. TaxID=1926288 RepID=UPI002D72FCDA|nr:LrgB family protein [Noviherbaspirillum sp.]HZW20352.1 LrgB family protein [Noviherbaspirillum sp.]